MATMRVMLLIIGVITFFGGLPLAGCAFFVMYMILGSLDFYINR